MVEGGAVRLTTENTENGNDSMSFDPDEEQSVNEALEAIFGAERAWDCRR